jgi:peptide methionine sulfoxide reductase msrA/msrB
MPYVSKRSDRLPKSDAVLRLMIINNINISVIYRWRIDMKKSLISTAAAILSLFSIVAPSSGSSVKDRKTHGESHKPSVETATFAGGCFWCVEADLEKVPGVISVVSGFSGGPEKNPDYHQVASGRTGHREAVQVTFDPGKTSYETILDVFFRHMDPTDPGGQFADRGFQYTTAVFYHHDRQKTAAEKYMANLSASGRFGKPLATRIIKFESFYPAGPEHQDYYKKNPLNYTIYRKGSGRDAFIERYWNQDTLKAKKETWQKPDEQTLRKDRKSVV